MPLYTSSSMVDSNYKQVVHRGYNATITEDNRFAVFRIRALYKETRDARIKKKKPEDFPKDSFAVVELGNQHMESGKSKIIQNPAKSDGWVAYYKEKEPTPATCCGGTYTKNC